MLPTSNFGNPAAPAGPEPLSSNSTSMKRWGAAAALVVAVVVAPAAHAAPPAPPRTAPLVITGSGGQQAPLTVPAGGLDVEYPFFNEPRLPGPDGTISGVVIQRPSDGRLAAGVVLLNAPGFDRAVTIPLVDFDHTRLA